MKTNLIKITSVMMSAVMLFSFALVRARDARVAEDREARCVCCVVELEALEAEDTLKILYQGEDRLVVLDEKDGTITIVSMQDETLIQIAADNGILKKKGDWFFKWVERLMEKWEKKHEPGDCGYEWCWVCNGDPH